MKKIIDFVIRNKAISTTTAGVAFFLCVAYAILSVWLCSNSILFNTSVLATYVRTHGHAAFRSSGDWIFYRPDLSNMLKPWRHTSRTVKAICSLNDTLGRLGIRFFVVPVPDKEAIIQSYSPFSVTTASNQRNRFLRRLARNNVRVIDLVPPFFANRHQDKLYLKKDTHWDQKGISLAAEIIASRNMVPPPDRPSMGYILKDTEVTEQGDVSMMVHDSAFFPRTCTMVLTQDSLHFSDSPASAIMIFGDSFTNANKRYGAGIGAWIAYFAKQPTFTYTNFGANDNGPRLLLKFLKNHATKPRVIIWVFSSRFLFDGIEAY